MPSNIQRCGWAGSDPLYQQYHDREWGVPCRDDRTLFEFLILEGAQAGLSWITILRKRDHYRKVYDQFNPQKVARYNASKVEQLLADPGIVRNRLKVMASITNAKLFLDIQAEYGDFASFIWRFVDDEPIINHWPSLQQLPATTPESDAMSRELKRRGFKFVGSTICYAYMQAIGMVNDHTLDCFRHRELLDSA
ncbi:DNA-3-methyladenine glycosylase I [Sedimenticola thiotaurini]|uniref:DNA-3-methyladenine glycosylase I n=1 Tax=Sedimenticola thiotaurini TaxID=1543721 RepID=A0A0F7JYG7_9GAMM|nr:DNA-3-methyladenine glycosylase I [Sedimenticola thiotaurini]AKH19930.1 DNA-3-methyladenine glycosylase [Sedimenticola thiotaurini]